MQDLRDQLCLAIKDLYGLDFVPEFSPAPANIVADYSSNAPLKLAKDFIQFDLKRDTNTILKDKNDVADYLTNITQK